MLIVLRDFFQTIVITKSFNLLLLHLIIEITQNKKNYNLKNVPPIFHLVHEMISISILMTSVQAVY